MKICITYSTTRVTLPKNLLVKMSDGPMCAWFSVGEVFDGLCSGVTTDINAKSMIPAHIYVETFSLIHLVNQTSWSFFRNNIFQFSSLPSFLPAAFISFSFLYLFCHQQAHSFTQDNYSLTINLFFFFFQVQGITFLPT